MITGRKHPQEALDLAMAAAAALERKTRAPSPERLSVYGALHLAAATAAAASFDQATTQSLLGIARGIADRIGEANHMGTAFGPVNPESAQRAIRGIGSELVRTSRLGLTCANEVWLDGCPQVKRRGPTFVLAA